MCHTNLYCWQENNREYFQYFLHCLWGVRSCSQTVGSDCLNVWLLAGLLYLSSLYLPYLALPSPRSASQSHDISNRTTQNIVSKMVRYSSILSLLLVLGVFSQIGKTRSWKVPTNPMLTFACRWLSPVLSVQEWRTARLWRSLPLQPGAQCWVWQLLHTENIHLLQSLHQR